MRSLILLCLCWPLIAQQPVAVRDPATGNTAAVTAGSAVKVDGSATTQPANVTQIGGTAVVADPCQTVAKSFAVINLTANTKIVSGTAAKQTYICSLHIIAGAATNVALVEGTGATCGTGTAGMAGGATAATGWNLAANGGLVVGAGVASVIATATTADDVCVLVSAANQISGVVAYVQK